jgi:hypothetical protein
MFTVATIIVGMYLHLYIILRYAQHDIEESLSFTGEDLRMAQLTLPAMGAFAEFERAFA